MSDALDAVDDSKPGVVIEPVDPSAAEAMILIEEYLDEIAATFGYDDTHGSTTADDDFRPPQGCLLLVRDDAGAGAGIGGVRLLDPQTAEVKRMYLRKSLRGRGAGWALLTALEAKAVELGATRGVLDTNETLTSALALYRAAGWQEVDRYNENAEATHWFAKHLADSRPK
jgi:GNAT superfamily N-acetyltransferase